MGPPLGASSSAPGDDECADRDALCPQLPRMHECKREAWPALWARAMNDRFACPAGGGGEHVVTNLCRAAAGTNYIVNRVAELQSSSNESDPERRALLDADVVVVETAANDVNELLKLFSSCTPARERIDRESPGLEPAIQELVSGGEGCHCT